MLIDGRDTGRATPIDSSHAIRLWAGRYQIDLVVDGRRYGGGFYICAGKVTRLVCTPRRYNGALSHDPDRVADCHLDDEGRSDALDPADVARADEALRSRVAVCRRTFGGSGPLEVVVLVPSLAAWVEGPLRETAVGRCVADGARQLRVASCFRDGQDRQLRLGYRLP